MNGSGVLIRDALVLAAAEIAETRTARRRGLLGRDSLDGGLVLRPCRQVHTFGMRFPIDVAFCSKDGRVLRTATMRPGRVSRVVVRAHFAVEASAGAFARWGVRPGVVLTVRESAARES